MPATIGSKILLRGFRQLRRKFHAYNPAEGKLRGYQQLSSFAAAIINETILFVINVQSREHLQENLGVMRLIFEAGTLMLAAEVQ